MAELIPLDQQPLQIAIVEDDVEFAEILRCILASSKRPRIEFVYLRNFRSAVEYLRERHQRIDLLLLDLNLPDSQGYQTFQKMHQQIPGVPIMIVSAVDDHELALQAVREGAQDYFLKGSMDVHLIPRILAYAVERFRIQAEWERLSIQDDLTRLYNRRGFMMLACQQLKVASRNSEFMTLFFIDLNNLKLINDTYGHERGDLALSRAAEVLRKVFRDSDIKSRMGGDEFAVLAIGVSENEADLLNVRLQKVLDEENDSRNLLFDLSISVGVISFESSKVAEISGILAEADERLYRSKKRQKSSGTTFSITFR